MTDDLRTKAERLLALHRPGRPLVLVNVWDAATARIVEDAGLPAVATTSAGVAFSHGYPDGEKIPRDLMLEAIGRICRAVSVPVTADMEAGYGATAEDVREAAAGSLEAGAVGLNFEDGTGDAADPLAGTSLQREKIRAIREAGDARGVPIVINARTDVYLDAVGAPEARFGHAVERGRAYREAGADCIFVPGVTDKDVITALVRELDCPVNVLAGAASPPIAELARAGVARVSLGSGPMRATMSLLQRLIRDVQGDGAYAELQAIVSHASMNALMR
ncbi:MAG: isocitrate lyase/phosphoenolpyruvate mutase family protein [Acidobacteriota bacterium]|nr:isocitrate lyase/phosphoenolpyruvate mutase family protein [Acidobacteriota bacterium]